MGNATYHVHYRGYRGMPAVKRDMSGSDAWDFFFRLTATGDHIQSPTVGYPVPDTWNCVACG